ncbi:MAG: UvrD-helicase domain-containing protein [Balneolaceae bacterium]|nr:UvrD-helicase domain-containing protein [Balneolaceae bacterium]
MKPLRPFEISLSGVNLVEASAGTGKTYNITSLYIRALIERDVTVANLLVVTYTEAATKELKDRLLNRIRESIKVLKDGETSDEADQFLKKLIDHVPNPADAIGKLEKAVRNFDEAAIYTIHGFCYQSLQEQAFESRAMYDAEMIGDDFELVQEAVDDYWRNWTAWVSQNEEKKLLLKLISSEGYTPEKLADELSPFIGKPYLHILPEKTDKEYIEHQLAKLVDSYAKLKEIWFSEMETLFDLLDTGDLSYYTTNKLNKWFGLMDDFLASDLPELDIFTQFYRFKQHEIDNSLKKKALESNAQPPQHNFFKLAEDFHQTLEVVQTYIVVFKKELLIYLREELTHKKEDQQVLSYDDLLLQLRSALLDENRGKKLAQKIRKKYPIALVDEFQDTDPNQYEIFRQIYHGHDQKSALFMIGDPKQSIYSFRGADIFSYLEARRDVPGANVFSLDKNFRSSPMLLEGLNTIWANHDNPFILEDITFNKTAPGQSVDQYDSIT